MEQDGIERWKFNLDGNWYAVATQGKRGKVRHYPSGAEFEIADMRGVKIPQLIREYNKAGFPQKWTGENE